MRSQEVEATQTVIVFAFNWEGYSISMSAVSLRRAVPAVWEQEASWTGIQYMLQSGPGGLKQ